MSLVIPRQNGGPYYTTGTGIPAGIPGVEPTRFVPTLDTTGSTTIRTNGTTITISDQPDWVRQIQDWLQQRSVANIPNWVWVAGVGVYLFSRK